MRAFRWSRASTGRANPRPLARSCIGWSSANPNSRFACRAGNTGAFKSLFRGSTLFTMINWMRHKRIHTKLDGHHPTAASHHQKIVIIDDALALMEALHRRDTHRRLMYQPEGALLYLGPDFSSG
jgi:hypothetical protein